MIFKRWWRAKSRLETVTPFQATTAWIWQTDIIMRVFFKETLYDKAMIEMPSGDGKAFAKYRQLLRALNNLPGVLQVRPYEHYLAVQWSTYNLPDISASECQEAVEAGTMTLLRRYFGWSDDATIGRIESTQQHDELRREADQAGISWQLGRW